ncbi:hypothetical protein [Bacillus sp. FJAT-27445]|uniref:hypothetical protein n=1 Tax=Bacillus sp. FJAT-27445 TaxID=1679166 RepID=UPI0007434B9D|nr:hypothetical protein [Bacillus sp. FJAT-27445]
MKKHLFLLTLTVLIVSLLASCSDTKIVDEDFDQVTFYKINSADKHEKVSVLTDKKKIEELTDLINEGKRTNAQEIEFEKGPDGILLFENKNSKLELNIFTETGHILTEEYYITSKIDINKYFGTKQ